jgi:hypothetical protein
VPKGRSRAADAKAHPSPMAIGSAMPLESTQMSPLEGRSKVVPKRPQSPAQLQPRAESPLCEL